MTISAEMYTRIVAAKLYIDKNFHQSISLDLISREACISRFHFHRLFTHVYHKTPHQYLTQKRIDLALELLQDEAMNIQEVCSSVGFESIGSFHVLFKKEIGFAPLCYRKKARVKRLEIKKQPEKFIPGCFLNVFAGT